MLTKRIVYRYAECILIELSLPLGIQFWFLICFCFTQVLSLHISFIWNARISYYRRFMIKKTKFVGSIIQQLTCLQLKHCTISLLVSASQKSVPCVRVYKAHSGQSFWLVLRENINISRHTNQTGLGTPLTKSLCVDVQVLESLGTLGICCGWFSLQLIAEKEPVTNCPISSQLHLTMSITAMFIHLFSFTQPELFIFISILEWKDK